MAFSHIRETHGPYEIRVGRVGHHGKYDGTVLDRENGRTLFATLPIRGEGAKARAADLCRAWVDARLSAPPADPSNASTAPAAGTARDTRPG